MQNEQSRQRAIACMTCTHTELHTLIFHARNNANDENIKQGLVRLVGKLSQAIASY